MIKIYNLKKEPASLPDLEKRLSQTSSAPIPDEVDKAVGQIIESVKKEGDKAVWACMERFDRDIEGKTLPASLRVPEEEIDASIEKISPELLDALCTAAENITSYHEMQKRSGYEIQRESGVILGQRVLPLERAGIYTPGGTARYPSTLLMNVLPAKIAGVKEIIITTPADENGKIDNATLAAAKIAGVSKIFCVGGAQAVAALAYGTESIPKVDKIVGPGNIFVSAAKRRVFGAVAIDMIAGPSEILIIADDTANPDFVAADMLGQAEHGALSRSMLICLDEDFAEKVTSRLAERLENLPRKSIAGQSIADNGFIVIAGNTAQAAGLANAVAAEHLELCVHDPFELMEKISHAGSVFLGNYSPEALGDYMAGTNHTLPTAGTARFSSPLSVDDFVKKSSYIHYTKQSLSHLKDKITTFAETEGLTAHAESIRARF